MHVNGTEHEVEYRISTPGTTQAVRSHSDLPVRARRAASTLPPAPQPAPLMLQRGHSRSRPVKNLPPKSAVEKTPESPVVLLETSTSDERTKITMDVKQTSRGVQRTPSRLERRRSGASAARQSVVGARLIDLAEIGSTRPTRRPTGTAEIDLASQKHQIIRCHHRREADVEGSTAH